jgi:hypothetical protein
MPDTRYAIVKNASSEQQLAAYLPANYRIEKDDGPPWGGEESDFLIAGEDVAGWTLDGYVIPRLASGLIWATEQFVWIEEDGGPESGPHLSVWLDNEPQTVENMKKRRREEEEEQGLICPKCNAHPDEGYEVTSTPTRQYGGGFDTFYNCKRCGFQDVAT